MDKRQRKIIILSGSVLLILLVGLFFISRKNAPRNKEQNKNQETPSANEGPLPSTVTFAEHIRPIVIRNCTPCHRKGESGPFELITYRDVFRKAKMVKLVTEKRYMPPWPADRTYSHFANEKGLSDREIALITKWVNDGCQPGDTTGTEPLPEFPTGSQLGKPDLVLRMPKPFTIKGTNRDHFMVMKIPFELPEEKYVRAIEFVPGNRRLLHHMNGHLITYAEGAKKNVFGGETFVDQEAFDSQEIHKKIDLLNDDGSYPALTPSICNFLPGVGPTLYPAGIGGYVFPKKGALYLKDIHYGPTPKDDIDQSQFNIFFGDKPPLRPTSEFIMGTLGVSSIMPPLAIPPNEIKTFETRLAVKEDISLLTVNPHMHLLGKKLWAFALLPNGDTIPLIRINNWDFRWQYFYTFKKMIRIPAGSELVAFGTFDNTVNNPLNPFNPPKWVGEREGSMRTTDEMFQFIVTYVPYRPGDENISLENQNP